ncbi:MAG: hypothetical protein RLZZ554_808, partial [Actinomycetota bacterium]
ERTRFILTGWVPELKGASRFRARQNDGETPKVIL